MCVRVSMFAYHIFDRSEIILIVCFSFKRSVMFVYLSYEEDRKIFYLEMIVTDIAGVVRNSVV